MVSTVNVSMCIFQSDSWFPLLMSVCVYFRVTHGFHCYYQYVYISGRLVVSSVNVSMGIFQSDSWFPMLMSVWVYFRVTHGFHC